jgi:glutaminyl-peptide cyclotransferase
MAFASKIHAQDFVQVNENLLIQALRNAQVPEYQFEVLKTYPHDILSFTEGLYFEDGYMYESTGLYGHSWLKKVELSTGKTVREKPLDGIYFGEGMTILNNEIYQLTWKESTGFVYDKESFSVKKTFFHEKEGWGLTTDGQQLIMSNGTATLNFLNPVDFGKTKTLTVTIGRMQIPMINELEYIDGMIYANIWLTSIIIIISPQDGKVQGWLNLSSNIKIKPPGCLGCVANGIAYDDQEKVIYITGKSWPNLYSIKLIRKT